MIMEYEGKYVSLLKAGREENKTTVYKYAKQEENLCVSIIAIVAQVNYNKSSIAGISTAWKRRYWYRAYTDTEEGKEDDRY